MALDPANYISELTPTLPDGDDPIAEGDNQIRDFKRVVQDSLPNIDAPMTLDSAYLNSIPTLLAAINAALCPVGLISMWSGLVADIPAGWALCDGTNSTPDLSGRFIVGYDAGDTDYDTVGETGGAKTATSSSNGGETVQSAQAGAHTHSGTTGAPSTTSTPESGGGDTVASQFHTHDFTTNSQGAHTHNVTTNDHDHTVDTRSPYFTLAYIMYTG